MNSTCKLFLILFSGIILNPAFAGGWVDSTLFSPKLFIENKGQFNNPPFLPAMPPILYAVNHSNTKIFFSNNKIAYTLLKTVKDDEVFRKFQKEEAKRSKTQKELEEKQSLKNRLYNTQTEVVFMDWMEANPDCKIEASGMANEYFNYGMDKDIHHDINFVKGYKKIIYKSIYDGIDIEYLFHEKTGIKYNIIVNPGSDISKIKLKYSGAQTIFLDEENNLIIKTPLGNIIDHAPVSLISKTGSKINTKFVLKNNILSFQVEEYDKSQTLVIDPWISSTLPEVDTVYEIAVDPAGNVFIYGDYNSQVKKYDNTGAAQWTFLAGPGFSVSSKFGGDITVDPAGSSYVSLQGDIRKLSSAGTSVWLLIVPINITTMGCQELGWRMVYNPVNNLLYGAGSNGQTKATTYDPATGNANWNWGNPCKIIQGPCPGACPNSNGEIRHMTLAPNGNFYAYTAVGDAGQVVSTITGFDTSITGIYRSCNVPDSPYWVGGTYFSGWFYMANGIAASNCFIYIYSGSQVQKFDIYAPTLLGTANITNGSLLMNSGILADLSNNFYVGTQTGISAYSPTFNLITSVNTSNPVYDMAFAQGNTIAACGVGFVGVYDNIVQTAAPITCSPTPNQPMTATADTLLSTVCGSNNSMAWVDTIMNGTGPYTLSWSNGATTDTILNLDAGNYSCIITDASCPPETTTVFISIPPSSGPTVTITSTNALCAGSTNGSANTNVTGGSSPYLYSWSPSGQTTANVTGLGAGSYTVTVTDLNSCSGIDSVTITSGNINITAGPDSTICSGQTLTIGSSGGTNYSWNSGETTASITISPTDTTTYSVIVSNGSCMDTAFVTITVNPSPIVSISGNTTLCTGDNTTLTASGGTNYLWSNGSTATAINVSPDTTEIFTVTASIGSCADTTSATVTVSSQPIAVVTGVEICSGQNATLTASGGANYSWSNGDTNSSVTISPAVTSTYTVIVSVGSCSDTANAIVTVNTSPVVALGTDQTICDGQNVTLNAGNPNASYLWSTGATSQTINVSTAGTYWVIIALNNCLAKDTIAALIAPKIHLSDSSLCTTSPILLDPGSGASGYLWSTGSTSQTISVDVSGSYSVVAIFGNCITSDSSKITGDGTGGLLFIPNTFTPNDDNLNEIFLAKGTGIASFNMTIFDRWGNLIFTSDDLNKGWNGKIEGGHYPLQADGKEISQEDVYVWKIEYTTQCFPDRVKKTMGHVSIVK
ncbi:MAG: gliding motility-associated C-terminal domain-containing protein [Bacteroidota bacterium]|nr:gliding motility-associated C-terminal domain-containing protein [Bacteroidota bacterium]